MDARWPTARAWIAPSAVDPGPEGERPAELPIGIGWHRCDEILSAWPLPSGRPRVRVRWRSGPPGWRSIPTRSGGPDASHRAVAPPTGVHPRSHTQARPSPPTVTAAPTVRCGRLEHPPRRARSSTAPIAWPSDDVVPGRVALERPRVRSPAAAAVVGDLRVHPTGVDVALRIQPVVVPRVLRCIGEGSRPPASMTADARSRSRRASHGRAPPASTRAAPHPV